MGTVNLPKVRIMSPYHLWRQWKSDKIQVEHNSILIWSDTEVAWTIPFHRSRTKSTAIRFQVGDSERIVEAITASMDPLLHLPQQVIPLIAISRTWCQEKPSASLMASWRNTNNLKESLRNKLTQINMDWVRKKSPSWQCLLLILMTTNKEFLLSLRRTKTGKNKVDLSKIISKICIWIRTWRAAINESLLCFSRN